MAVVSGPVSTCLLYTSVSKTAVWLKKERATHEWQIELVQVLEKFRLFERGTPAQRNQPTGADEPQDEAADEPTAAD